MDRLKSLLIMVLMGVLRAASPELRELLENFIQRLWEKAQSTDNPIDDVLVRLLAGLVDVDLD